MANMKRDPNRATQGVMQFVLTRDGGREKVVEIHMDDVVKRIAPIKYCPRDCCDLSDLGQDLRFVINLMGPIQTGQAWLGIYHSLISLAASAAANDVPFDSAGIAAEVKRFLDEFQAFNENLSPRM